jgi:hypothetical protein
VCVAMSYARSLRRTLKDKNEALFTRLGPAESAARSVLTYTTSKFPYYTPHDFSHSQNVEEILNWLVPDEVKMKMSDCEIFFLLISAWLHDWGMVASEHEDPLEVRKDHHLRSEANFEKLHDIVGLSLAEGRIVGRICRGHREEDLLDPLYADTFYGSNVLIRIRFLAALLRMADECDVTANRTPEIIYHSLKPEGASEEEFQKHLSILGIGKLTPYKLLISGIAKTPKGVEVIDGVTEQIQRQLNSVKTILASNGVMLDIIEARIDNRGFINKPIEFELDRKNIVSLLIGSSLYSRVDTAIRELLQNALDTCRFRKLVENGYNPLIEIEFGKGQLSFEDNGIGMNFENASDFFSKKGHSFYVSKEFQDALKGKRFDAISKFGIGVLSAFLISDNMIVETKKQNCAPCRFTIMDLAEGWKYEEGSRSTEGTKVTLILNDQGKKLDVLESLQHYAKNVVIPIFVKNLETGQRKSFTQLWNYNIKEIREELPEEDREKFVSEKPILSVHVDHPDLDVTYHLFGLGSFYFSENCVFLLNGVYVGTFDLFQAASSGWVALIDCKSNLVDLKVSREDFVENEKFSVFRSILYDTLIRAAFLNCEEKCTSGRDEVAKIVDNSSFLMKFLGNTIVCENFEDASLKFVTARKYPVMLSTGMAFLTFDEIKSRKDKRIIHYKLPTDSFREHMDLTKDILQSKIDSATVLVFDFGPYLHIYSKEAENSALEDCGFCGLLCSEIEKKCMTLKDMVSEVPFKKQETSLDSLLPPSSFFAHLMSPLRGMTIASPRFEYASAGQKGNRNLGANIFYEDLVGKELFDGDAEIQGFFTDRLRKYPPGICDFELVSRGSFIYDYDDPFNRFIISKADYVLSNLAINKTVQRYMRLQAMTTTMSPIGADIDLEILLLEKTIAESLGYPEKYVPFWKRKSSLARLASGHSE